MVLPPLGVLFLLFFASPSTTARSPRFFGSNKDRSLISCLSGPFEILHSHDAPHYTDGERLCRSRGMERVNLAIDSYPKVIMALHACLGEKGEAWIAGPEMGSCIKSPPQILHPSTELLGAIFTCRTNNLPTICIRRPPPIRQYARKPENNTGGKNKRISSDGKDSPHNRRCPNGRDDAYEKPYLTKPYRGPAWKPTDKQPREKPISTKKTRRQCD